MADTTTASGDAQAAIYRVLTADATLMSQVSGVFDVVPDGQPFPYITLGDTTSAPDDTFTSNGEMLTATLHIWSRPKAGGPQGYAEALGIAGSLYRLLHRVLLPMTAHASIFCLFDYSETIRDSDGLTRHVPVRYRILTEAF